MDDILIFDLETAPDVELLDKIYPVPPFPDFDESSVKMGNLKDPAKRALKLTAEREKHEAGRGSWDKDYREDIISSRKAQLNPSLSYVCGSGWKIGDRKRWNLVSGKEAEKAALEELADRASGARCICGWNIHGFDLPYVTFRMRLHGIRLPDIMKPEGRYYGRAAIDLMKVACSYQYGNNWSLKDVAPGLGFHASPDRSGGRDFYKKSADDQMSYLAWDVLATEYILGKFPDAIPAAFSYPDSDDEPVEIR